MTAQREASARRDRRWVAAVGFMSVFVLACSACGGTGSDGGSGPSEGTVSRANKGLVESDEKPRVGGRLVYGLIAETNGWNPTTNQWAASGLEVAHTIFDTMTAFDETGAIHPYFAEKIDHNDAFTRWTFQLRRGVNFSNGKPVTAEAVARTQNMLKKSPTLSGVYAQVKSISVEGDDKVVVDLEQPVVQYPMVLSSQVGVIADPDWLETNDSLHPIGSGPFILESWEIGNKLVVKKNPSYWRTDAAGTRLPYLDAVEFRVITDTDSRGVALRAGDIDIMQTLKGSQIQSFQELDGFQVFSTSKGETRERFIQLNTQMPPFDDVDARMALAYATDKDEVVQTVTDGFDEPANGPFSPKSRWYTESGYPQLDRAKAKELVDKVKAKHGGQFAFTLAGAADPITQQQAQVLQQQWREVGIDMTIDLQEQAKMIIVVVTGQYQAVSWGQFDAPNPLLESIWWDPKIAVPPPTFSLNFARIKDEEIGAAIQKARASSDISEVTAQYAIVQKRLGALVPYVWLYHEETAIIASNRVVNMTRYTLPDGARGLDVIQGRHPLYQVWLSS